MALLLLVKERRKDEENIVLYQAPSRLLPSFCSFERVSMLERISSEILLFIHFMDSPTKISLHFFHDGRTLLTNQNGYKNIF